VQKEVLQEVQKERQSVQELSAKLSLPFHPYFSFLNSYLVAK